MDTTEPTPSPNGDRLSVAEAAEMLGVHSNTIRHRLKRGLYPSERVLTPYGEAYMIPRAVIEADAAGAPMGSNGVGAPDGATPQDKAVSLPLHLSHALETGLAPLVEELARSRADAAAAHERAGRLQAERDAAVLERNMERTRRYELEQKRRAWWWRWWTRLWGGS